MIVDAFAVLIGTQLSVVIPSGSKGVEGPWVLDIDIVL
jgi:hypothetical protein